MTQGEQGRQAIGFGSPQSGSAKAPEIGQALFLAEGVKSSHLTSPEEKWGPTPGRMGGGEE